MKAIQVTDDQYDFLVNLSKELKTQNNRLTQHPLFCVYQKTVVYKPEDCGDEVRLVDPGDGEEYTMEELKDHSAIVDYLEAHPEIDKAPNLDYADIAMHLGFRRVACSIEDVPVGGQVYFTEKAAQAHIVSNHYHYKGPFIYVESAWRNPEIQKLREILTGFKEA